MPDTNPLTVSIAPPPSGWVGGLTELFGLLESNTRVNPLTGTVLISTSATEPVGNVGPWLRNGVELYTYDPVTSRYRPLNIVSSLPSGSLAPTSSTKTDSGFYIQSTGVGSVQLWYYQGPTTGWSVVGRTVGATRPSSPAPYERFFDTDIGTEIYWNGSNWVTCSGCRGDIKAVTHATLADALDFNPGWADFGGAAEAGRVLGVAGSGTGLTPRAALFNIGTETHTLTEAQIPAHSHTPLTGTSFMTQSAGTGGAFTGSSFLPSTSATTQTAGGGQSHPNMQPTRFLYHLYKAL